MHELNSVGEPSSSFEGGVGVVSGVHGSACALKWIGLLELDVRAFMQRQRLQRQRNQEPSEAQLSNADDDDSDIDIGDLVHFLHVEKQYLAHVVRVCVDDDTEGHQVPHCYVRRRRPFGLIRNHEFVVVRVEGYTEPDEYAIVDPHFRRQFCSVARKTSEYGAFLACAVPRTFVGTHKILNLSVYVICSEMRRCFQRNNMPFPPWREARQMWTTWTVDSPPLYAPSFL